MGKSLNVDGNTLTRFYCAVTDICGSVRGSACGSTKERRVDMNEAELEGAGWYWFYVCGECRGVIKPGEEICPHCKERLIWNGSEKNVNCRPVL